MFNRLIVPALITTFTVVPVIVSCSSNKASLSVEQQIYAGNWIANDGTFVKVYLDGSGDFKTSNSTVTGGTATITDKNLKIAFGPIKKEFKITQPPQEQNGKFTMQLDGITYTKEQLNAENTISSPSPLEVKSSTTEEKSQAVKELENTIIQSWQKNFGTQLDSLNCSNISRFKAGDSLKCKASIENIPFQVRVNFQDDEGNFKWESRGLLVLAKVEDTVVELFKKSYGTNIQADCGTSRNQKYRSSVPQDTFECKASDGEQNVKTVKITVQDEKGTVQVSPIS